MSELYNHDTWLNPNIIYSFSHMIYEYDMKNAGYNLAKAYQLLPEDTLSSLGRMKKERRTVEIGKLQMKNQVLKESMQEAFKKARRMFFEANMIEDGDVISIKKDAIFLKRPCEHTTFLEYIDFRIKNTYTSYLRLQKRIEVYYQEDDMDIKGLGDAALEYHKDYLVSFLRQFCYFMETDTKENTIKWFRRFVDKYKQKELPLGYYRRFQQDAYFDILGDDSKYYEYWEDKVDEVDITFNYFNLLTYLAKIPL